MLGSTVFSRVFLYVTQLIIKVPSVPVRLSCVTHPIRVMEQPLVAAALMIRNKWPLPTRGSAAQRGSHRGPQPQWEFIPGFTPDPTLSISPLYLYLSHFTSVSSYCTSVIARSAAIVTLSSPVTSAQQFACRFCHLISAKVTKYYIMPSCLFVLVVRSLFRAHRLLSHDVKAGAQKTGG